MLRKRENGVMWTRTRRKWGRDLQWTAKVDGLPVVVTLETINGKRVGTRDNWEVVVDKMYRPVAPPFRSVENARTAGVDLAHRMAWAKNPPPPPEITPEEILGMEWLRQKKMESAATTPVSDDIGHE